MPIPFSQLITCPVNTYAIAVYEFFAKKIITSINYIEFTHIFGVVKLQRWFYGYPVIDLHVPHSPLHELSRESTILLLEIGNPVLQELME